MDHAAGDSRSGARNRPGYMVLCRGGNKNGANTLGLPVHK